MSVNIGTLRGFLELEDAASPVLKRVSTGLDALGGKIDHVGSRLVSAGSTLTATVTAPILGIGYAAISAGNQFTSTMNRVEAVTNASVADFKRLNAAALEWGGKTQYSAAQAADAMLELGKAGFTTDQTIGALPSTLQLAAAANLSLGDAAALTSNTMKTFGLQIEDLGRANDILAAAANASTIDVADMRESLKYVGPVAYQAGVTLAQASAAMALMGEAGIKGSMAGTSLRTAITTLMTPTKQQAELMKELGLQGVYANGRLESLDQIVRRIQTSGADGAKVLELFGDRAGPGMAALVQKGADSLSTLTANLEDSEGAAAKMAAAAMKGLPGALERMRGSIETANTALYAALEPSLIRVADGVARLADFATNQLIPAFQALPSPVQSAAFAILALGASAGPAAVAAGGLLKTVGIAAGGLSLMRRAAFTLGNTVPVLTARLWLMDAAGGALSGTLKGVAWSAGAVGAAFAGWHIGKWIGETTGLTDWIGKKLAGALYGVSEADYEAMRAAQKHADSLDRQGQSVVNAGAALDTFVGPLQELAGTTMPQATDASKDFAEAVEKIRVKLSGAGVLTAARQYEAVLKSVGGVSRLTKDEQLEVRDAFQQVIEKYRQLGPSGASVVAHFEALNRTVAPLEPQITAFALGVQNIGTRTGPMLAPANLSLRTTVSTVEQLQRQGLHSAAALKQMGTRAGELPPLLRGITTEERAGALATESWTSRLGDLARSFEQLANISGGTFGGIVKQIGQVVGSIDLALRGTEQLQAGFAAWKGGDKAGGLAGIASGAAGAFGALQQATSTGSTLGNTAGGALTGLSIGTQIGGPIGGAIGAAAGGAYGFIKSLFDNPEKKINPVREGFIQAAGGLHALNMRAAEAGVTLTKLLDAKTPEQYKLAIDQLTSAFDFQTQSMQLLDETVKRYGFSIEELGPALQRQELDKQAASLSQDFAVLTAGGIEAGAALRRMSDNVNDFINRSLDAGQKVPESMRPMLQRMADMGLLVDKNGKAFGSLEESGVQFTTDVGTAMQTLGDKIGDLTDAIKRGLGDGLTAAAKQAKDAIERIPTERTVRIRAQRSIEDVAAGGIGGGEPPGIPGFKTGTGGEYVDFGPRGTLAVLHNKERVMTEAEGKAEQSARGRVVHMDAFLAEQRRLNEFLMNKFGPSLARAMRDDRQVARR